MRQHVIQLEVKSEQETLGIFFSNKQTKNSFAKGWLALLSSVLSRLLEPIFVRELEIPLFSEVTINLFQGQLLGGAEEKGKETFSEDNLD